MEGELDRLDQKPCPVCFAMTSSADMAAHVSQCVVDLKAWVTATVNEQHVNACERQAKFASQEAARIRQTMCDLSASRTSRIDVGPTTSAGENESFNTVIMPDSPAPQGVAAEVMRSVGLQSDALSSPAHQTLASFLEMSDLTCLYKLLREHGFSSPKQIAVAAENSDRLQHLGLSARELKKLMQSLQPILQSSSPVNSTDTDPMHPQISNQAKASSILSTEALPHGSPAHDSIQRIEYGDESGLLRESRAALERATTALAAAEDWRSVSSPNSSDEDMFVNSSDSMENLQTADSSPQRLDFEGVERRTSHSVRWMHSGNHGTEAILDIGPEVIELRRAQVFTYDSHRALIGR
eukprot:SAG31_NODE_1219_length_9302_cov_13.527328_8_plen_353_part_00